jgi:BCD family chlorophyll transporter-like MFS transporter
MSFYMQKELPQQKQKWFNIFCIGVIQACMGAVVVTTTTTLNRVMVVELALPATLPGFLVSLHYFIQMVRPRMGYGADKTSHFTKWIFVGMVVLALGGVLSAQATVWLGQSFWWGFLTSLIGFSLIGVGVSACGTTLLVLLSKAVGDQQRAGAATLVWMMMIFGFALTSIVSGKLLDPFSFDRLFNVSLGVSLLAVLFTSLSLLGLERRLLNTNVRHYSAHSAERHINIREKIDQKNSLNDLPEQPKVLDFKSAMSHLWKDDLARLFTYFVFTSMLAYSAQDLIMEPFAALIYQMTPGQTTQLSGKLHAGILLGMLLLALIGSGWVKGRLGQISTWMSAGCLIAALGMTGLSLAALLYAQNIKLPINLVLTVLGVGDGIFSIAAISTMMRLSTSAEISTVVDSSHIKPGIRMGLWGGAQAVAFGLGGIVGTGASDLSLRLVGNPSVAYACVFSLEAAMFLIAAYVAWRVKSLYQVSPKEEVTPQTLSISDKSKSNLSFNVV